MNIAPRSFALVHTWPHLRNAEYEVVQRIVASAHNIGVFVVVIEDNGKIIWSSPDLHLSEGSYIKTGDVDFLLSLHFLSPRLLDIYSYITLWQPIQFYHQFGYAECVDKVGSHNDLISCDSDLADQHGLNLLSGLGRTPAQPMPKLFHAVAQPFLSPNVTAESRLFYIGINWERLGGAKGRFHDTLSYLDAEGLTDIYGPQKMHGEAVWDGFKTYRGELAFDGESIKYAANRAGICLALSSRDHKHAGIMSNRLFEGLGGGAAVIATPNPFIQKYFQDIVYLVDDTKGDELLGQQIIAAMRKIRMNPEEAMERILKGQAILKSSFSFEHNLSQLFEFNNTRISEFREKHFASGNITIILSHFGDSLSDISKKLEELAVQHSVNIAVQLICSDTFYDCWEPFCDEFATGSIKSLKLHRAPLHPRALTFDGYTPPRGRLGPVIAKILLEANTEYFAFLRADEHIFSDHYTTLIGALKSVTGAKFGCSGALEETRDASGMRQRKLTSLKFSDFHSVLLAQSSQEPGRFIFHRSILNNDVALTIPLLDGEEATYFQLCALLEGPLAQSAYATYVLNKADRVNVPLPVEPVDYQLQYIRDAFAADTRWVDQVAKYGKKPEFVYAFSHGGPARWDQSPPQTSPPALALGTMALFKAGSPAVSYLVAGFSSPEPEHVWIEGERGVLEFTIPNRRGVASQLQNVELKMRALGRRSSGGLEQHCTIALNGAVISYIKMPESESELSVPLPNKLIEGANKFRLELIPDHREPVVTGAGSISDPRLLSIMLKSLMIVNPETSRTPRFAVGELYKFETGAYSEAALYRQFYGAEDIGAWMAARHGALRFTIEPSGDNLSLELTVSGRRSFGSEMAQTLRVTINGIEFPELTLEDGANVISLPLPDRAIKDGIIEVDLEVRHAEAVFDAQHNIIDPRLLGLCLHSIKIQDQLGSSEPRTGDEQSSSTEVPASDVNAAQASMEMNPKRVDILTKARRFGRWHRLIR